MSILGKYTENNEYNEKKYDLKSKDVMPAVLRNRDGVTFKKSLLISSILHPTSPHRQSNQAVYHVLSC